MLQVGIEPCVSRKFWPGPGSNHKSWWLKKLGLSNFRVSAVLSVEVYVYNQTFSVDRNQRLFVNGIRRPTPYYHPNVRNVLVAIRQYGGDTHIESDFKLKVTFRYGKLCVTVPKAPPFIGSQTLCGLAGNIDNNCTNDLLKPYVSSINYRLHYL